MVIREFLIALRGWQKRLIAGIYDVSVILIAIWLALALRLGEWGTIVDDWGRAIAFAPLTAIPAFVYADLYRLVMRHLGYRALWMTAKGVTLAVLAWGVVVLMLQMPGFPRSVVFIYWFIAFAFIAGGRLLARALLRQSSGVAVAIYGAGSEGVQLATALQYGFEYRPVVFLDDSANVQGSEVANLRVHSPREFAALKKRYDIKEVFIAVATPTKRARAELVAVFDEYPVRVRALPLVSDLTQNRIQISDLEPVQAEDLLGRDPVPPDRRLLTENVSGKTVMVTGAGGSIGAELCRQIMILNPRKLILFEQSEYALYQAEQNLLRQYPNQMSEIEVLPVLGSVESETLMQQILSRHHIQTLYHAAAYKHVPLVESNVVQGVRNNVLGTLCLARAAIHARVETFILISTDKAVRSTSVMGASKRFAEMILQALADKGSATCFSMVRFGNVLDSSGSVVPRFRKQIARGGPVTVTHQDMTRYFMTVNEAVELVIQSGALARGGEVFVLDMGDAVRIDNLARTMIHLSGLRVKDEHNADGDIEIQYTGIRSGEKLTEELLIGDDVTATEHPKILRSQENFIPWAELEEIIGRLKTALENYDVPEVYQILNDISGGHIQAPKLK